MFFSVLFFFAFFFFFESLVSLENWCRVKSSKTNKKNPGLQMPVRVEISTLLSGVGQSQQRHGLIDRLMAHSFMIFDAFSGRLRYKCHPNFDTLFRIGGACFCVCSIMVADSLLRL